MADDRKKLTKKEIRDEIISWIITIVAAAVISCGVNLLLIVNAIIPSSSMEPTIMVGDRIFGNRLAYIKEEPARGDIVIFEFPDNEKELFIKRVIGLPGDTVEVIDGKVYINGSNEPLVEPYLKETPLGDFGPYEVPEGCFFMMGDNRNNSADSRYWVNTYVTKDEIVGKAVFRYYKEFGKIESYNNY